MDPPDDILEEDLNNPLSTDGSICDARGCNLPYEKAVRMEGSCNHHFHPQCVERLLKAAALINNKSVTTSPCLAGSCRGILQNSAKKPKSTFKYDKCETGCDKDLNHFVTLICGHVAHDACLRGMYNAWSTRISYPLHHVQESGDFACPWCKDPIDPIVITEWIEAPTRQPTEQQIWTAEEQMRLHRISERRVRISSFVYGHALPRVPEYGVPEKNAFFTLRAANNESSLDSMVFLMFNLESENGQRRTQYIVLADKKETLEDVGRAWYEIYHGCDLDPIFLGVSLEANTGGWLSWGTKLSELQDGETIVYRY